MLCPKEALNAECRYAECSGAICDVTRVIF
jgi:hypothetical protein